MSDRIFIVWRLFLNVYVYTFLLSFQIFRRSTEATHDRILKAKNQATDRKTKKLGHKYRYWIPMIDPIDRNGRKIVGLYHYDAVAKK